MRMSAYTRKTISVLASVLCILVGFATQGADANAADAATETGERPNILWIVIDDMSCDFGYQGQPLVDTPHVDRLAKEGVVFSNAYVTAAVCSSIGGCRPLTSSSDANSCLIISL